MQLQDLVGIGVLFVVIAIVLAFGGKILDKLNETNTANSAAKNATDNGLKSINEFASWLPTLAIVVVAAIIIGIVVSYFAFGGTQG